MSNRNFFAELKRRNVYKVAVAYMVVAWLLMQAASNSVADVRSAGLGDESVSAGHILGFPAALIFSWAFEITPEGIKLESEIAPNKSVTHHTGRKIVD